MYRLYRTPSMWREMERLRREMNRLFDGTVSGGARTAPSYPAMNVWAGEEGLIVTSEVPGVSIEDLEINVVNDTLTLSGHREPDQVGEETRYHRRERGFGKFTRTVQLPFRCDANKVEATLTNGILRIELPRVEEEKPIKISVKAA
jgi:HSP20 family protein